MWAVIHIALLVACVASQDTTDEHHATPQHLYDQVIQLRSNSTHVTRSAREQQQYEAYISALLHNAAGVQVLHGNTTTLAHAHVIAPLVTVDLQRTHPQALWDLAHAYMHGHHALQPSFAVTYQLVHVCAALGHAPCQTEQGLYHAWGILPEAAPGVVADTETAGGNRIVKTASSLLSSGASPSIAAAGDDSNGGEEGSIAAGDDEDEYDGGGEHHNGHAAARNAASNRAASNAGSDKGSNAAVSTAQGNVRPLPMMLSEPQPAMGVLHYFFAAAGGEDAAQMVLGYRHKQGLSVPASCQAAAMYYTPVAERVAAMTKTPGTLPKVDVQQLSSRASHGPPRAGQGGEYQVLHYQWVADRGDANAQYAVGQLMAQLPNPQWQEIVHYYRRAAEQGNADALAALGHAYANGLGVEQNNKTAFKLLSRAAEGGHPSGMYGLGYMYLTGHGVEVDLVKAARYLRAAGDNTMWPGAADAWFHLGVMHQTGMGVQRNQRAAANFFRMGAKLHHIPAMFNLAMLRLGASDSKAGCAEAVTLLKYIAERGPWGALLQGGRDAHRAGNLDTALWKYMWAAEMGYEVAQANAAWLLREAYGAAEGGPAAKLAVAMHRLAAGQGNVESILELGDAYYYGRGVEQDMSRAAEWYQKAAAAKNVQAMFNLGYMHEYGAGLTQDFHLAKRYYDQAIDTDPRATVPVMLALMAMSLHIKWHALTPLLPQSVQRVLGGLRVFTLPSHQGIETVARPNTPILSPAAAAGLAVLLWPFRLLALVLDVSSWQLEAEWVETVLGWLTPDMVVLVVLVAALYGVLKRRQQLRQRQVDGRGGGET